MAGGGVERETRVVGHPVRQAAAFGGDPDEARGRAGGDDVRRDGDGGAEPVGAGAVGSRVGDGGGVDADDDVGGVDGGAGVALGKAAGVADEGDVAAREVVEERGFRGAEVGEGGLVAEAFGEPEAQAVHAARPRMSVKRRVASVSARWRKARMASSSAG